MIFLPKYIYMLVALEDKGTTLSKLQHKIKLTYAHASNIKKELIKRELVFEKKNGRETIISLTEKGKNAVKSIKDFMFVVDVSIEWRKEDGSD